MAFLSHSQASEERLIADSKLGISNPPLFPVIWSDSKENGGEVVLIGISEDDAIDPSLGRLRHLFAANAGASSQFA